MGSAMSSLKVLFGNRLRELRQQKGMTQLQLGVKIGLTREEINRIEQGLFGPRFESIESIAQELRVPVWQLFYFESP
jgi:transcriptional regulator with XRE-family HTH domain